MTVAFHRAGPGDWHRIWPVWRAVVAPGDTYAFDPSSTSVDAQRIWLPR